MGRFDAIFSAFELLDKAKTEVSLRDTFAAAVRQFGYDSFMVVSSRIQPTAFDKMFILDHWPRAWRLQYHRENLILVDPVANYARKSFDAFGWHDAPVTDQRGGRVLEISAVEHGLRSGLCVPIRGTSGYQATVSLAGHAVDESSEGRRAVEMMALYLYKTNLKLRSESQTFTLTPREREVMKWAAVGKSAWDTGEILHISEQTVKSHISSVLSKLGVCSKTQAVVESIRRGEIHP